MSDQPVCVRQRTPVFSNFLSASLSYIRCEKLFLVLSLVEMEWEKVVYHLTFKVHIASYHKHTIIHSSTCLCTFCSHRHSLLSFFSRESAHSFSTHSHLQKYEIRVSLFFFICKRPCKLAGLLCHFMHGETVLEKLIITITANIYRSLNICQLL